MKRIISLLMALLVVASMSFAQSRRVDHPLSAKAQALMKSHQVLPQKTLGARKSAAPISTFPYTNDFEDGTLGGWNNVDSDNDGKSWSSIYLLNEGEGHNGSAGFASSASYDNDLGDALTPDNWLISPAVVLPSGIHLQLSWYAAAQDPDYPADHYSVYVSTDSLVTSFTTAVFSETLSSVVFTKHTVDLSAYAGQTIFIAFRHHNCSDEFVVKIDDIRIAEPGAPIVDIVMPTYAFAGDTVSLAADLQDGEQNGLTWSWTIAGADVATSSASTLQVVWANAGTYAVQLIGTNALGVDTAQATIHILDCSTVTDYPYLEGFENGLGCWTSSDADGDGNGWFASTEETPHTGNGMAVSESYGGATNEALTPDNWLVSPAFQLPQDGEYELSWYVMPSSTAFAEEHYSVYVSTTGRSVADFTQSLFTETLDETMEGYAPRAVSLSAYAGQTLYVAFRHHACTDMMSLLIDDVKISQIGAPVATILAPDTVRTSDHVTFVSQVLSSSAVTYAWSLEGADPATATTADVTVDYPQGGDYVVQLVVVNAYGSDTATHSLHVIDCSGHLVAPFAESFEGGLGCWNTLDLDGDGHTFESIANLEMEGEGYLAEYAHSGEKAVVSWSFYPEGGLFGEALNANDVLVSPAIELADSAWKLGFFASSVTSEYPDDVEVRLATVEPTGAADFTVVLLPKTTLSTSGYQQFIIDLSAYAGQTIYLGFFHENADQYGLLLDDISISTEILGVESAETPAVSLCPNPTTGRVNVMADEVVSVEVLDMTGRTMLRAGKSTSLDLSAFANGIYLVRVQTEKGLTVSKIVKK